MKYCKRFLLIILCAILLLALVSCNKLSATPNGKTSTDKIEPSTVQSIHFTENLTGITSRRAQYYMDYSMKYITEEEYQSHPDEIVKKWFSYGDIDVNKTVDAENADPNKNTYMRSVADFEELTQSVGKTYYIFDHGKNKYAKITYHELVLAYLNITFLDDGSIYLSHYVNKNKDIESMRIKANEYAIQFFTESDS